jgi:branched-chain amino acid transport system permease protein
LFSVSLRYILNSMPIVAYVILLSYSFNFLLYISNRVSLTFAGIYLIGAYVSVSLGRLLIGDQFSFLFFLFVLLITSLVGGLISVVLYGIFERFLQTDVHRMVATSSLLLVFGGVVKLIWGTTPITYSVPFLELGITELFGIFVPRYYFFMLGIALLVMIVMAYFIYKTSWGLKFRASSLDGNRVMAQCCGVNQNVVTFITFAISGMLAGLAGGLYAPITGAGYGAQSSALLLAALSVIIGGVGSIWGAILAAFIMGIAKVVTAIELPVLELAIPFIIASIVLIIRPYGIWGKEFKH